MDALLGPCLLLLVFLHAGYAIPSITPEQDFITVNSGQEIRLQCKDENPVYWILQKPLLSRKPRPVSSKPFQGNPNEQQFIVPKAQAKETGRYICINKETSSNRSIYVFVKDSQTPFLSSISNSVDGEEGHSVIVMCPANDPTISDFTLRRCDGTSVPEALTFSPDILQGIILKNLQKSFEGCYICSAKQDGQVKTSQQFSLNVKPVHKVIPIIFLSKNSQLLKQGEKFEVVCTIRDVFSTVEGSWKNHPNMQLTSKSKYHADSSYELNLTLSRPSVEVNDSGIFTCQARNAVGMSHASIILNVIDGKQKVPQRGPSGRSLSPAPLVEGLQRKKQRQKIGYRHSVQAKSQHLSVAKHSAPDAKVKRARKLSRKRFRAWMARLDNYMARQEENVARLKNHLDHIVAMIGQVEERLNTALERAVSYK